MARYRNRRNFRSYRPKFRSFGGRRFNRYGNRARGIAGITMPWIAGAIVGLTDYDKNIDPLIKIGLLAAPTGLTRGIPMFSQVRGFVAGMLIGDIIQGKGWFSLGSKTGSQFKGV